MNSSDFFVGDTSFIPVETTGVKYLGSKKKLLFYIGRSVEMLEVKSAVDVFTGTTRVAQFLKGNGIVTDTSDLSWASTAYAHTFVHNKGKNTHLQPYIDTMNGLTGVVGWLSANYAGDAPQVAKRSLGRCFQLKNTMKADAARDYVDTLKLAPWEKYTLIVSIILGLDVVDNTVGVQQAYLKEWCIRSYNDVIFKLPIPILGKSGKHFESDCLSAGYRKYDLAYYDPPYSPHSYSTYYHIWDSIVKWDKPATALKSKRRVDRVAKNSAYDNAMESPWNSAKTALDSTEALLKRIKAKYHLLSYSNESLIKENDLLKMCSKIGETTIIAINYKRNIMSQIGNADKDASKNQRNKELLILIKGS